MNNMHLNFAKKAFTQLKYCHIAAFSRSTVYIEAEKIFLPKKKCQHDSTGLDAHPNTLCTTKKSKVGSQASIDFGLLRALWV